MLTFRFLLSVLVSIFKVESVYLLTRMTIKCTIGMIFGKESECELLWLTSKKGEKVIVNELTADEVYTLLLRTGLCVEQLDMESTICFHHEHYYLSNDKFFNGKNDKCVDPFKEHKSQFRGILIKYFFTFLRLIWCLWN